MNARSTSPPDDRGFDFDAGESVLLLSDVFDPEGGTTCASLLQMADPSVENVLMVTFTASADDRLTHWETDVGTAPANLGIVTVNAEFRADRGAGPEARPGLPTTVPVELVRDPSNFTGLGVAMTDILSEWDHEANRTVVCFRSVTAMLQYAEPDRVYQFLHVLLRRLTAIGAVSHFHLDPGAHDEQTLQTVVQLFDTVVERGEDGFVVRKPE